MRFLTLQPGINEIGIQTKVSIEKPHPSLPSFVTFPSPQSELTIFGELAISDTILNMNNHDLTVAPGGKLILKSSIIDMGGSTLRSSSEVNYSSNSKLIGNMRSVRDDVSGVVQLAGNINIEGSLETDGIISLGATPGSGLITGDLTLFPGSDMLVEFAGTESGTGFDFLEVGGTANLDGKLTMALIDEYIPDSGEAFLILKAGALAGSFDKIDQGEMGRQRRFQVATGAEGLVATSQVLSISSYTDWRAAFLSESEALDDLISGFDADPEKDGTKNLLEYLTNGIPLKSSPRPLRLGAIGSGSFTITLANDVADYTWQMESSTDLVEWIDANFSSAEVSSSPEFSTVELQAVDTFGDEDRFFRLTVESVQP